MRLWTFSLGLPWIVILLFEAPVFSSFPSSLWLRLVLVLRLSPSSFCLYSSKNLVIALLLLSDLLVVVSPLHTMCVTANWKGRRRLRKEGEHLDSFTYRFVVTHLPKQLVLQFQRTA